MCKNFRTGEMIVSDQAAADFPQKIENADTFVFVTASPTI